MKLLLSLLAMVSIALPSGSAASEPINSLADLQSLQERAEYARKSVVLFFTISDGSCHDCDRMWEKFLSDRDFSNWLDNYAVVGIVNASNGSLHYEDRRENFDQVAPGIGAVMRKVHLQTIPSIVLIARNYRLIGRVDINHSTAEVVEGFQKEHEKDYPDSQPAAGSSAATTPAVVEPTLKLKMISGTGERRLATINDETFFAGETRGVSVGDQKLPVQCLSITETSAVVKLEIEANPVELKIGESHKLAIQISEMSKKPGNTPNQNPAIRWIKQSGRIGIVIIAALALLIPLGICYWVLAISRKSATTSSVRDCRESLPGGE